LYAGLLLPLFDKIARDRSLVAERERERERERKRERKRERERHLDFIVETDV
jgi:hypothetical protein